MDNKVIEGVDEGTVITADHPLHLGTILKNAGVSDAYRKGVDGICGISPDERKVLDADSKAHLDGIKTETAAKIAARTEIQTAKRFE